MSEPASDAEIEADDNVKDGETMADPGALPPSQLSYADCAKGAKKEHEPWLLWICAEGEERLAVSRATWKQFQHAWLSARWLKHWKKVATPVVKWYGYGKDCGYITAETEADMEKLIKEVKTVEVGNSGARLKAWRQFQFGRALPITTIIPGPLKWVPAKVAAKVVADVLERTKEELSYRGLQPPVSQRGKGSFAQRRRMCGQGHQGPQRAGCPPSKNMCSLFTASEK